MKKIKNLIDQINTLSFKVKSLVVLFIFLLTIIVLYYLLLLPALKYKEQSISQFTQANNTMLSIVSLGKEIMMLKSVLPEENNNIEDINVIVRRITNDRKIYFTLIDEQANNIHIRINNVLLNELLMLLIDLEIIYGISVHKINIIKNMKQNDNVLVSSLLLTRFHTGK